MLRARQFAWNRTEVVTLCCLLRGEEGHLICRSGCSHYRPSLVHAKSSEAASSVGGLGSAVQTGARYESVITALQAAPFKAPSAGC